jgi:hypothetical protein
VGSTCEEVELAVLQQSAQLPSVGEFGTCVVFVEAAALLSLQGVAHPTHTRFLLNAACWRSFVSRSVQHFLLGYDDVSLCSEVAPYAEDALEFAQPTLG